MSPAILDGFPANTFADLQTEFYARGYDYLNEDEPGRVRAKRWLNQAYFAICELYAWPFLDASHTQHAPLALDDVGHVYSVVDATNECPLARIDPWEIDQVSGTVGSPFYWYFDGSTIKVYPEDAVEVTVRYARRPTRLVTDDAVPLVPYEWFDVIVDGAVIKALKDDDNWNGVLAARDEYDRQVAEMVNALMVRSSEPGLITRG